MVLSAASRRVAMLSLLALALGASIGVGVGVNASKDPALVFGGDAGVVLTFVLPEKTTDFDRVLERFRGVLEESEDPIRRQQAQNWVVYKSPDPGPGDSVLYVSFMEPVLRGANYNIADIMADELDEDEAEQFLGLLESALAQPQSTLSLEAILGLSDELPPELTETEDNTP